jgi:ketosteroid isomerase-like protein
MRRVIVPLILVCAVSCQPATNELTEERKAEVIAEVGALNLEYWDAWRAADWDRGMAYYVNSPDFVWAAGGAVTYGYDALEALRPQFESVASQAFRFRTNRVTVMAPNAATVTATGTWAQTDTAGVTGPARPFAWTSIWVWRDGEWKIHVVHMSYPAPPPESM